MALYMQPLEAYKNWVRDHPFLVQSVERALQLFAWSPQRFSSSEFAYESYSAAIGLLSLWHESIIHGEDSSRAVNWQTCLTAVELVQTLVEIRGIDLERQGKLSRYGPLALLELAKASLRLKIWRTTDARLAVVPSELEDQVQLYSWQQQDALEAAFQRMRQRYGCEEDDNSNCINTCSSYHSTNSTAAASTQPAGSLQDKLSALYAPTQQHSASSSTSSASAGTASSWLPSFSWLRRSTAPASTNQPTNQQQPQIKHHQERDLALRMLQMGEALHLARPVIYVLMLKRYGRTSWKPWCTSLLIDLASASLHSRAQALLQQASQQQPSCTLQEPHTYPLAQAGHTSLLSLALQQAAARSRGQLLPSEQQALSARKVALLRYLIRSPCFDVFTRGVLQRVTSSVSWLPGVSHLGEFVYQLVEGMQQYYSYVEA